MSESSIKSYEEQVEAAKRGVARTWAAMMEKPVCCCGHKKLSHFTYLRHVGHVPSPECGMVGEDGERCPCKGFQEPITPEG